MLQFLKWLDADPGDINTSPAITSYLLPKEHIAPQYPTRWSEAWTSNFSSDQFRAAVARAVEYVHAGDIFQVNIAQRLMRSATCHARDLYLHLRNQNPVPFGGYADFGRTQVVSSSPERFLQLSGREVETRPIKGTRPRLSDPAADKAMAQLLAHSEKDRAENVMIVDLLRNDLSRVADIDSVQVTSLCQLEAYRYVWHLVSVVRAQLAASYTACDLLQATFPGGSITGAPKIRAMEIISELEPTARGPYCGSLGYLSFAGDMDLSILIRTLTACDGWWQVPVGGGIVAASDPVLEEQETWHKAEGVLRAIASHVDQSLQD
jgi:para-aminobenzoate synthetase component 1